MSIECSNCHTANPDAASFCYGCGTRLATEPAASAEADELAVYAPSPAASAESTRPPSPVGTGWQPAPRINEKTVGPMKAESSLPIAAEPASGRTVASVAGRGSVPSEPQTDQTERRPADRVSKPRRALGFLLRIVATVALSYFAYSLNDLDLDFPEPIALVLSLGTIALLWGWPLMHRLSGRRATSKPQVRARGEVHDFRERVERSQTSNPFATQKPDVIIWTFRLDRYEEGQRLSPIPIEMHGTNFSGFINNGDTIELREKWREGRVHQTRRVYNVTNGVEVTARKRARLDASGFVTILIILAIVFVIILGLLNEIH